MKVSDIMTKEVICAEVPGTTREALDLIIKHNISGLPVVKRGTRELVGIVTKSDFARKPEENQLALLMTKNVVTINPSADIREAAKIFVEKGFRRLPVVDNGNIVGIISVSDVVWKGLPRLNIKDPVEKFMEEKVITLWQNTPLKVAHKIMRLSKERALLVLDNEGKLVGIIEDIDLLKVIDVREYTEKSESLSSTEGDKWGWDSKSVVYIMKRTLELPDKMVKDVMVTNVITALKSTSISEVAKRMAMAKINQVPIIDAEGEIIGIVKDINLLKAIV